MTQTHANPATQPEAHVVQWIAHNLAEHLDGHEVDATDDAPRSMAKTLQQARVRYVDAVASSGRLSLHNGDDIATLLAGATPEQTMEACELLKDMPTGTLATRYERLNPGQKRMNSGNQIRSLYKKGEVTLEDVAAALGK